MLPRISVSRTTLSKVCLPLVLLLAGANSVAAQDYNIDYDGVPGLCSTDYGGAILEIQMLGTITASQYLIIQNGAVLSNYNGAQKDCAPHTWFTYACNGLCTSSIKANLPLHLGVTVDQSYMMMKSGYVYNNKTALDPWRATDNAPLCSITPCAAPATARNAAPATDGFACLSGTGWWVHTNGKTLTVTNGSDGCPCPGLLYVGQIRFEYYTQRQALSTLNRYSERGPFQVDTLAAATMACAETLNFSNDAPAGAKFVVVNAKADVSPALNSAAAVEVWMQEVILGPGEHLITAAAEPHGTIDPRGPVVVTDHGNQTLHIIPDAGYVIRDVLVDGVSVGRVTTFTFSNVTSNHEILAKFGPPDTAPVCSQASAEPSILWPPNHKFVQIHITGITDADDDPVSVTVNRITQDEPLAHTCGGAGCPDAILSASGEIQLRAERNGNGNGRVYTIEYTANDGRGGTCDGSVRVCVPHDRGHSGCSDDGQIVNSLGGSGSGGSGANQEDLDGSSEFGLSIESTGKHAVTIRYSLPTAGLVHLAVFDLAGHRIVTLEDDVLAGGDHESVWNTSGLARGIYFCRLQVGSVVTTRSKVILE